MKVADLIKANRDFWDEELIKEIVTKRDANIIICMPKAKNPQPDGWY